jgi:hypothetical protein
MAAAVDESKALDELMWRVFADDFGRNQGGRLVLRGNSFYYFEVIWCGSIYLAFWSACIYFVYLA